MIETPAIPVISVIVPCYGQSDELPHCLQALSTQRFEQPYEIILVDSASDPEVARRARSFPGVRLIRSPERLLCGSAKNLGAENAVAEYLAFTDSDCIPESGWLKQAYQALEAGKLAAGGPVLDGLPRDMIALADNLLQFADVPPGRPAGKIKHMPGCNLAVQKKLFFEAGAFPDELGEDVKFSASLSRIYPEGFYFVPEMKIAHSGRRTWQAFLDHNFEFGYIRGYYALLVSERQALLGRRLAALPFVVVKRLVYIFRLVISWNLKSLARNTLLLPLILAGLTAWAAGFRRGCINRFNKKKEDHYEQ